MSRLNWIFAFHALLEIGVGATLILSPHTFESALPLADNTAVLLARGYGAAVLAPGVAGMMSFNLPDMLPCKRALAVSFMIFHALLAFLFFQGGKEETLPRPIANAIMGLHLGVLAVFYLWFKVSEGQVKNFTKQQQGTNKSH